MHLVLLCPEPMQLFHRRVPKDYAASDRQRVFAAPGCRFPFSKNCGNLTASTLHKGARDRTHRPDQDGRRAKAETLPGSPFTVLG
jgi:hypothetical protein